MKGKNIIAFFVIANLIAFVSADFIQSESIKMEESKSRVEVKTGSEMGGGFKQMTAEEVKIEKIDIQPTTTYLSPEVKKRQQFKYFNNTYTYITFRPSFLKTEEGGKKPNLKSLWNDDIV